MSKEEPDIKGKAKQVQNIRTFLAFALMPLAGFATDIYIPSLPEMAGSLHASNIQVQFTLSIFLICYGVSQLFIGSFLDSFGRHKIGIASLIIFAISSIAIARSQNLYFIYAMRALEAMTAASIVVAKRAYFVDVFTGAKLQHYLSLFSIIWSTGPIIAPFIGGYLQSAFGWQSNFYFLAVLATIFAGLEYFYGGESLKYFSKFHLKSILRVYINMLRTTSFVLGLFIIGFSYCTVMVYNMTGAFIIEHHLNFSPVIAGYCSLILGFAWMVGGLIGKSTINFDFTKKLLTNLLVQIVFILTLIFCAHYFENIYLLVIFAFLVHVTAGFAFNVYFTYCLSKFPKNAGIASGLTGGVLYIIVAFLSYETVYFIPAKNMANLGYSYLLLCICSAIVMSFVFKRREKTEI